MGVAMFMSTCTCVYDECTHVPPYTYSHVHTHTHTHTHTVTGTGLNELQIAFVCRETLKVRQRADKYKYMISARLYVLASFPGPQLERIFTCNL